MARRTRPTRRPPPLPPQAPAGVTRVARVSRPEAGDDDVPRVTASELTKIYSHVRRDLVLIAVLGVAMFIFIAAARAVLVG